MRELLRSERNQRITQLSMEPVPSLLEYPLELLEPLPDWLESESFESEPSCDPDWPLDPEPPWIPPWPICPLGGWPICPPLPEPIWLPLCWLISCRFEPCNACTVNVPPTPPKNPQARLMPATMAMALPPSFAGFLTACAAGPPAARPPKEAVGPNGFGCISR